MTRLLSFALFAISVCGVSASRALAQQAQMVIHVRVVDSTGAPIAGAEVTPMHGRAAAAPAALTDQSGARRVVVARTGDDMEIVVRKIGFQRGDQFFHADRDSLALVVRLRATVRELPAVQVTAEQMRRAKRNFLSADDIAASDRTIDDGLDAVMKLRPDMYDPPGQGVDTHCGLFSVFVNGARISLAPFDPKIVERTRIARRTAESASTAAAMVKRPPQYRGYAMIPPAVSSVLASIHPEHIQELNMVDCRDYTSNDVAHGQNALFVALKPGVAFVPGRGSYVVDEFPSLNSDAENAMTQLPSFRLRVLGVFDANTGVPVENAEVLHLQTGTYARTTSTGTVTLAFLPTGCSSVQVRRAGYADVKLDVVISPSDTIPVTVLMFAAPPR